MIQRARRVLSVGVVGAVSAVLSTSALGVAVAAPADDTPPPAVETFDYPDAAKILKEQGIALRKGDGHVLLSDCRKPSDIQLMTAFKHPGQTQQGMYCFKVTGAGKTGWLTLEVPQVYMIMTGDHSLDVKLDSKAGSQQVKVGKNAYQGVGMGVDPNNDPTTLVEIRVTG
ncbi:hypothetical protein ACFP1Z_03950 [Streptomyces gamaensis]|uniref:Secreted protein n=1 Tax=Streptomyces gamaensis TaxID=1763542 RepID=A0ABW0YS01_9ACTN